MKKSTIPMLVTFDGEARSGKGTIVQATKDYLRDVGGYKTMLIDRGQTFRALVIAITRAGIDINDWEKVDEFLLSDEHIESCTAFVKQVYRMTKAERDPLIYTNEVGATCAIVGSHASSQLFVKNLTKKWIRDAIDEGYQVVLIDGRTLEGIAVEMDQEGLCDYRLGLYFVCDAVMGARRTLGFANTSYADLNTQNRREVDELVAQIHERNRRDKERDTERLLVPTDAPIFKLPDISHEITSERQMLIIDSSAELSKAEMSKPVAEFVYQTLSARDA